MARKWLRRAALLLGGLALAAQCWVALSFIRTFVEVWAQTRTQLVSFAESANRFSQLKTPALKYPASGVYFALFVVALLGLIGSLAFHGVRDALSRPPEPNETGDR